ncbi:MAG: DUF5320 domain-containing protein [Anaerolineaceae bacterium]|nr:DUF5320 domain-containing protein [Anaerolineaceae bacterium]MBN2677580.1 DUF5320 domain-containing protein [Anaerolineaceae bacterium]
MPGRDGTGPMGRGARTGRGIGNCTSPVAGYNQPANVGLYQPNSWGGRVWNATFGRLFGRRRPNRRFNR